MAAILLQASVCVCEWQHGSSSEAESKKLILFFIHVFTFQIVMTNAGQWVHHPLDFPHSYAFPLHLVTFTNMYSLSGLFLRLFSRLGSARTDCALFT